MIRSCVLTKGIKVETLPTFDIEYLFLNIRGKSVGEDIDVKLTCPDDNETEVSVNVNLDDIQVEKPEGHSNRIKLDKNLMMELKYPSLNEFIKNNFDPNDATKNPMEQSFELIGSCISKIYNEDEVWAASDCSKKEISDFLDSMNSTQFKEVEKFFETMPRLTHTIKVVNPKTKVESDVVLEGLASFFG